MIRLFILLLHILATPLAAAPVMYAAAAQALYAGAVDEAWRADTTAGSTAYSDAIEADIADELWLGGGTRLKAQGELLDKLDALGDTDGLVISATCVHGNTEYDCSFSERELIESELNARGIVDSFVPMTGEDVAIEAVLAPLGGVVKLGKGVKAGTKASPGFKTLTNTGAPNNGVPSNWTQLNPAGAQINRPAGFTSYRTPDGDMVHVSPSGLQYGADPKFGNRVDNVLDHTAPNPSKPVHSVFNARGDDALRIVDDAWVNRTGLGTLQSNGNRTWTVDLGRSIGTNGQTSVQIVVRDGTNEIITAFPK